jgi:predicted DNA-binding protein
MASERYEIRLDTEHKRRLRELAAAYGVPASQVVKDLIDKALEDRRQKARMRAAEELASINGEDVPDMEVLKRQLGRSRNYPQ